MRNYLRRLKGYYKEALSSLIFDFLWAALLLGKTFALTIFIFILPLLAVVDLENLSGEKRNEAKRAL